MSSLNKIELNTTARTYSNSIQFDKSVYPWFSCPYVLTHFDDNPDDNHDDDDDDDNDDDDDDNKYIYGLRIH